MDTAKLVFKVLSQEASEEEITTFNAWLARDKDHVREFNHLQELWMGRNEQPERKDDDSFYDGLIKIKQEISRREKKKKSVANRFCRLRDLYRLVNSRDVGLGISRRALSERLLRTSVLTQMIRC